MTGGVVVCSATSAFGGKADVADGGPFRPLMTDPVEKGLVNIDES
jgi:hypothetical protein